MKIKALILMFIFSAIPGLWAESFEFPILKETGIRIKTTCAITPTGFFLWGGGYTRSQVFGFDNGTQEYEIIVPPLARDLLGPIRNHIYYTIPNPDVESRFDSEIFTVYKRYDLVNRAHEDAPEIQKMRNYFGGDVFTSFLWMEEYQNGEVIIQGTRQEWIHIGHNSSVYSYNFNTNVGRKIEFGGDFNDLSSDKMHSIVTLDSPRFEVAIRKMQLDENIKIPNSRMPTSEVSRGGQFLNNEIICLARGNDRNDIYLMNVNNLNRKITIRFTSDKQKHKQLLFSPALNRAIGENVILDTTPFRNWLDENGFLFKPTTATATETQIRVRENPNLEAQNLGHLTTGDELEVIDRSGIKVQIGDYLEWWYKIKRKSDGLEGWAYGAFIDVAEEQGLLGAEVLGLK